MAEEREAPAGAESGALAEDEGRMPEQSSHADQFLSLFGDPLFHASQLVELFPRTDWPQNLWIQVRIAVILAKEIR